MTIKARDAANALKTASAIKMRDAAGALKTVTTIKMRDAANALKTAYSAVVAGNSVSLSPFGKTTNSTGTHTNVNDFTAITSGNTPLTYTWTLSGLSGGAVASILSGQGTPTCRVSLTSSGSATARVTVTCQVHFDIGANASDSAIKQHTYTGP